MDDGSKERNCATRRTALKRVVCLAVIGAVAPAALAACGGELACDDVSGLSPGDRTVREAAQYRDRSDDPARRCRECTFFQAAGEQCGTCTVVRGPIHPEGTCQLFAAKT